MIYVCAVVRRGRDPVRRNARQDLGVHTEADFLVAGRKLPWPVLVFTLLSSWIGAGSLFGGGENAYRNGFGRSGNPPADGSVCWSSR